MGKIKDIEDLELKEKLEKLKRRANKKPFVKGVGFKKGKKPKVSGSQGIKVVKGLFGY